jgi:hypothetical protein
VQQALERLALLLAREGVGRQNTRHHQGHDHEQRCEQVAVHQHEQLLTLGQLADHVAEPGRYRLQEAAHARRVRGQRGQPDGEGQHDEEQEGHDQHRQHDRLRAADCQHVLGQHSADRCPVARHAGAPVTAK